jgi:phospholipid/cholesterol/gamma-HCH transport system substrate-binding protein
MKRKPVDNIKLGVFVMTGVLFLVFSLYMIGKNRSLFGSTFAITASFTNTNGLVAGNYVRFAGINVGTVRKIEIVSDTSVVVTMVIDNKVQPYIKQNARASIGTEGLMGNKLININSQEGASDPVTSGSVIQTLEPIETDEMLRTLNTTNDNIAAISLNLREITAKLNSSNSLWTILSDTLIAQDLKHAVAGVAKASSNTEQFTKDASELMLRLRQGRGLAETVFMDTSLSKALERSVLEIQSTGKNLTSASNQLKEAVAKIDQGKGTVSMLLSDSVSSKKLRQTILNVEQGTSRFNENMEALKRNFLFRKYFREQEKKAAKGK